MSFRSVRLNELWLGAGIRNFASSSRGIFFVNVFRENSGLVHLIESDPLFLIPFAIEFVRILKRMPLFNAGILDDVPPLVVLVTYSS